ncbi:SH3 domain-containing protein [Rhodanobacter sp. Col0626]|uniref:SH3 domain-containing protein n=1 Tax=Rhodanobacter sp. Col0626 TaxID=3415679 RepID=UPI003CF755F0
MKHLVRFALASLTLASASLAFPALAQAADGYVTGNVNLRAGPDTSYPLIDQIPAGTGVDVQGCTDGWEWCDVIVYGNRGWVAGNYVEYVYQDQPVLLPAYGAQIGIPIVSFVIGTYWDNYYRSRPFYRDRAHWYHRPIVRRPPPPPIRHPYRPPAHGAPGHGRPPMHGGTPGHGRPPVNRPRPPAPPRPMQPRPNQPPRPVQGNRPAPAAPHGAARPTRPATARPTVPPQPGHAAQRPAQPSRPMQPSRPAPAARPAPQNRPPMNHAAPTGGHAPPARSGNGKAKPASRGKDDHHGH